MTDFKIHFRGVGVYVANAKKGFLTQVLFPRADEAPPDGEDDGFETQPPDADHPKPWPKRKMKHADDSVANEHFAGAAIVGPGGDLDLDYRDLTSRAVERSPETGGGGKRGVPMDSKFLTNMPPLDDIIIKPNKKLKLLNKRDYATRLATNFTIDGDPREVVTATVPSGQEWVFKSANGSTTKSQDYCLEALWRISAKSVVFKVNDLVSGAADRDIVLDATHTEVYFYNFDLKDPTIAQLRKIIDATADKVDDDFKWVYKLFEKKNHTWQEWLEKHDFPAPVLAPPLLPSVSTCFETVWTGGDA